jgi:hypothetical protein
MHLLILAAITSAILPADSIRLNKVGQFTLPAGAEITAMNRYGDTTWVYDATAGRLYFHAGGRTAERAASCKDPKGGAITGAWFTAHGASLAMTVESNLWTCDVRTQKARVAATLKSLPARVAAYDGARIAYSSMSDRFTPQVSIVDLKAGTETAFAVPEVALPRTPARSLPFFPFTISSGRVVVGDPLSFALRYIDPRGEIVQSVERPLRANPYPPAEAKRLSAAGTPGAWIALGQPLFNGSTIASDVCGHVWVAIQQPGNRTRLIRIDSGREDHVMLDGEVVKLFLTPSHVLTATVKAGRTTVTIYSPKGGVYAGSGSGCNAGARKGS